VSRTSKNISRIAQFIGRRIYELQGTRSQLEIAKAAGFDSPNMLSMLKTGKVKLPLDRVERLARALDCSSAELARLALEQYFDRPTLELLRGAVSDVPAQVSESDLSAAATAMLVEAQLAVRDARYAAQLSRSAISRLDQVTERLMTLKRHLEELAPAAKPDHSDPP